VGLFYAQIDGLIKKRLGMIKNGYKPSPDAGVDLLDLFMQSTDDPYTLGGMVFGFLVAGREFVSPSNLVTAPLTDSPRPHKATRPRTASHG
jgi:hypothetical protein